MTPPLYNSDTGVPWTRRLFLDEIYQRNADLLAAARLGGIEASFSACAALNEAWTVTFTAVALLQSSRVVTGTEWHGPFKVRARAVVHKHSARPRRDRWVVEAPPFLTYSGQPPRTKDVWCDNLLPLRDVPVKFRGDDAERAAAKHAIDVALVAARFAPKMYYAEVGRWVLSLDSAREIAKTLGWRVSIAL